MRFCKFNTLDIGQWYRIWVAYTTYIKRMLLGLKAKIIISIIEHDHSVKCVWCSLYCQQISLILPHETVLFISRLNSPIIFFSGISVSRLIWVQTVSVINRQQKSPPAGYVKYIRMPYHFVSKFYQNINYTKYKLHDD